MRRSVNYTVTWYSLWMLLSHVALVASVEAELSTEETPITLNYDSIINGRIDEGKTSTRLPIRTNNKTEQTRETYSSSVITGTMMITSSPGLYEARVTTKDVEDLDENSTSETPIMPNKKILLSAWSYTAHQTLHSEMTDPCYGHTLCIAPSTCNCVGDNRLDVRHVMCKIPRYQYTGWGTRALSCSNPFLWMLHRNSWTNRECLDLEVGIIS